MGGFHYLDLLIILVIGAVILGPKTLQSIARSAGKGASQARAMKDKVMAELPMEEISQVASTLPRIPLNSRQAAQMLIASEFKGSQKKETSDVATTSSPSVPTRAQSEAPSRATTED